MTADLFFEKWGPTIGASGDRFGEECACFRHDLAALLSETRAAGVAEGLEMAAKLAMEGWGERFTALAAMLRGLPEARALREEKPPEPPEEPR